MVVAVAHGYNDGRRKRRVVWLALAVLSSVVFASHVMMGHNGTTIMPAAAIASALNSVESSGESVQFLIHI